MQLLTLYVLLLVTITIAVNGAQVVSNCVVYRNKNFQTWVTTDGSSSTSDLDACHLLCLHLSGGCAAALFNKKTVRPNPNLIYFYIFLYP